MNIIYEGKEIANNVEVLRAYLIDNASGVADSLELVVSDIQKYWSKWNPKKGDQIIIKKDSFSSGAMFVDQLEQLSGRFTIKAISIPLIAKTPVTRYWENVRFLEFVNDIARKYGFKVDTYGVSNWLYEKVEQLEQADFEFLHYRCVLEGYCLKITDKTIVIYDEKMLEQQGSVKDIYINDVGIDYEIKTVSSGLYSASEVQCNKENEAIKYVFNPASAPQGPVLKKTIYLSDQAEGIRFAKGLLRYSNKLETTGGMQIDLASDLAAGCNVGMNDFGILAGKAFIYQAIHMVDKNKSLIKLRKPLEGY